MGKGFSGVAVEGPQLSGQMGAIISVGHPREIVGSKVLSSMEVYDVEY